MLINLSNHPSGSWGTEQMEQSRAYGEVVDLPFPQVNPRWSEEEFQNAVEEYYRIILKSPDATVLLQGEHVFVFRLASRLKSAGIAVVAAMSERVSVEQVDEAGNTVKVSKFRFEGYREY